MNCYKCINAHTGAWDANDFEEISYSSPIYSPLDIIQMVSASCDTTTPIAERFNNQIAAAQCIKDHLSDDNTAIVARMGEINWSKVDAVVILGGTNDYGDITLMGETGSTNPNYTLGAINEIVRILCSTYKGVALYYVTPVVHWRSYNSGGIDDANWCDNYIPSGMGITRGEFYKDLQDEFEKNHIPALNLYQSLGWNIYNFSEYFNLGDGTHPRKGKGFYQMAKKISGFLEANKVF